LALKNSNWEAHLNASEREAPTQGFDVAEFEKFERK